MSSRAGDYFGCIAILLGSVALFLLALIGLVDVLRAIA